MTITYYDYQLRFEAAEQAAALPPEGWTVCDDDDPGRCLDLLCDGHCVLVRNHHGLRQFRNHLMQRFRYVKAAGGRVESPAGSSLLIRREGCWDLPKGMVEPGETLADAALREVREETGLPQAEIGRLIAKTYHIYNKYGGWHLKQTSWYAMHADQEYALQPQTEESISEALWVPKERADQLLRDSFASLRLLTQQQTQTP